MYSKRAGVRFLNLPSCMPCGLLVSIYGQYMQVVVNIRLYEYWHEQVKIRKKRWNNKEIKKFYWKLEKRGVVSPCNERLWSCRSKCFFRKISTPCWKVFCQMTKDGINNQILVQSWLLSHYYTLPMSFVYYIIVI